MNQKSIKPIPVSDIREAIESNQDGFHVFKLHFTADEDKRGDWAEKIKREMPSEDFAREYDLKPVGHATNHPVFADYRKALHEDSNLVWQPSKGKTIYRGWDFGLVHPCVEFMQAIKLEKNFIGECYGENILLDTFVREVLRYSSDNFPGCTFIDWVDVSGKREDQWANSSFKTLREYGIKPRGRWREVEEGIRKLAVEMVRLTNGRPHLMINPQRCPKLAGAFRGGYERDKKGKLIKDGRNDHPVDSARYIIQGIDTDTANATTDLRARMKAQYNKPAGRVVTRNY